MQSRVLDEKGRNRMLQEIVEGEATYGQRLQLMEVLRMPYVFPCLWHHAPRALFISY